MSALRRVLGYAVLIALVLWVPVVLYKVAQGEPLRPIYSVIGLLKYGLVLSIVLEVWIRRKLKRFKENR